MENLKKETIEKLKEIKSNLIAQTNEQNYCDMINAMIDYDNEDQDNLCLYDTTLEYYDFIDNELLGDYITQQLKDYGVNRVRCILNNTYDDDIYYIDAYGNLNNVSDDIFKECIDNAIEMLQNAIEEEKKKR